MSKQRPVAFMMGIWFALMATLAANGGCGNTFGNRARAASILVKIPNSQPNEKYAFLIRLSSLANRSIARDIFVPTELGGGQLAAQGISINLKDEEQGFADIKVYRLLPDGTLCADGVAERMVEINEIKPYQWEITGFEEKKGIQCPLTIDRERRYGEYIPGGKMQVTSAGGQETLIDCGTKCYYFFPQNSAISVLAVPQENYKFSDVSVDVPVWSRDKNTITVTLSKSANLVPTFISASCIPGSGMVCEDPTAPPNLDLVAISGTSENDVWAVGSKRTGGGVVSYYTAGSWRQFTPDGPPPPAFSGIWMSGPGNAWVVGGTKMYNCKPTAASISCTLITLGWPGGASMADSILGITGSGGRIWLLGSAGKAYYDNLTATGASINLSERPAIINASLIAAKSRDEVYVAGDSLVTCSVMSPTMNNTAPASPYVAFYFQAGTQDLLLADQSGGLLKYGGSGMPARLASAPAGRNILGMFRDDMGRVWVVGDSGFVQLWSNDTFSTLAMPAIDARTTQALKAVWSYRGNTWLVGNEVVRFYKG